jgi:hypothetical protein
MLTGFYGDADIPLLMADFGVAVAIAGFSPAIPLVGIVDYEGKDVLVSQGTGGVSGTDITVWIQTSTLPVPLRNKTLITVDGKAMRIRDQNQQGDGALTKILCEVVK